MNYNEILASLGLLIEEYSSISEVKEIFNESFIQSFKELYLVAQNKNKELSSNLNDYITSNADLIMNYTNNASDIEKNSLDEISKYQSMHEDEKNACLNKIKESNEIYDKLNDDIKVSLIRKDNITKNSKLSREIDTDSKNESIKSHSSYNLKNYNHYVGVFNSTANLKYKKLHSSISKTQYDLIDFSKKQQKNLDDANDKINKKIEDYKENISSEETKLNSNIKKIETKLNEKIGEIQLKYNTIVKQNAEQYKIEVSSINVDIEKIEEMFKNDVQNINIEARKKVLAIDKKYNKSERDLKQKLQDKKYQNRIKNAINKSNVEHSLSLFENKNLTRYQKSSLKAKYKFDLHKALNEKKIREREITMYQRQFESLTNKIMKEKKEVDAWRQYNINIKTIEKESKIKSIESTIKNKTKEKNQFDIIQRNNQAKEINNEKRKVNILILNLRKDFDSFNAKVEIEINKLKIIQKENTKDKEISIATEKEIIKFNQNYDSLSQKYLLNQALYNIEKNKYLNEYNSILIDYEVKKNTLGKERKDVIDKLEFEKYTDIANETIEFNNNSKLYYENILKNFIDTSSIHLKNNISIVEINKNKKINDLKYNIQIERNKYDIFLLQHHIDYINFLIETFSPLFLNQLNNAINNYDESSSIYNDYFSSICNHMTMFINAFLNEETKILNNHIKLDTGTKYSSIYSNTNYEYKQKLNAYNSQIENYRNTNYNYKKTIKEFYRHISELNYRQNKLLGDSGNNKTELQNIKKEIIEYQSKNKQNRERIDTFDKQIESITKKINLLTKDFLKKHKFIKREESKESEDSRNAIEKLKITCNYYVHLINQLNSDDYKHYLLAYKKNKSHFSKFNNIVVKRCKNLNESLVKTIETYNFALNNSLEDIKLSNYISHKKNRLLANDLIVKDLNSNKHEFIRLKNQFEDNVNFHINKLNNISKNSHEAVREKENIYNTDKNSLDLKFDTNRNKYFLRFKSCDDLIAYSTNNYKNFINHYNIIKQNSIKSHTDFANAICTKESKTFIQIIERYKNEINMIPHLTTTQIYETNVDTDEKNKELDIFSKQTIESTRKSKEELKIDLSKSLFKKEEEKREENKKYIESIKDIKIEFEKKDKSIKKIKYKE